MIPLKLPSALLLAAAILPLSVSPAQAAPLSQQEQFDQSRAQEAARQERLQFPKQKAELYLGLNVGAVYGYGADLYNGHVLAGATLGVRGTVNDISYDVFAAASIEKPEGFHTPDATCGFSLGWRF